MDKALTFALDGVKEDCFYTLVAKRPNKMSTGGYEKRWTNRRIDVQDSKHNMGQTTDRATTKMCRKQEQTWKVFQKASGCGRRSWKLERRVEIEPTDWCACGRHRRNLLVGKKNTSGQGDIHNYDGYMQSFWEFPTPVVKRYTPPPFTRLAERNNLELVRGSARAEEKMRARVWHRTGDEACAEGKSREAEECGRIFKLVEVTQACDPLSTGKKPKRPSLRLVRRIGLSAPGAACMLILALAMYVDSVHTRGRIG
ncbi:hypothetical protein B0H13DRAFT_1896626 [Mycena leptocephala]|nr:hypothetical protein B0H13DRAFT_1896626 [Mycena leptocephala]